MKFLKYYFNSLKYGPLTRAYPLRLFIAYRQQNSTAAPQFSYNPPGYGQLVHL
jgi:hypothetical protein